MSEGDGTILVVMDFGDGGNTEVYRAVVEVKVEGQAQLPVTLHNGSVGTHRHTQTQTEIPRIIDSGSGIGSSTDRAHTLTNVHRQTLSLGRHCDREKERGCRAHTTENQHAQTVPLKIIRIV